MEALEGKVFAGAYVDGRPWLSMGSLMLGVKRIGYEWRYVICRGPVTLYCSSNFGSMQKAWKNGLGRLVNIADITLLGDDWLKAIEDQKMKFILGMDSNGVPHILKEEGRGHLSPILYHSGLTGCLFAFRSVKDPTLPSSFFSGPSLQESWGKGVKRFLRENPGCNIAEDINLLRCSLAIETSLGVLLFRAISDDGMCLSVSLWAESGLTPVYFNYPHNIHDLREFISDYFLQEEEGEILDAVELLLGKEWLNKPRVESSGFRGKNIMDLEHCGPKGSGADEVGFKITIGDTRFENLTISVLVHKSEVRNPKKDFSFTLFGRDALLRFEGKGFDLLSRSVRDVLYSLCGSGLSIDGEDKLEAMVRNGMKEALNWGDEEKDNWPLRKTIRGMEKGLAPELSHQYKLRTTYRDDLLCLVNEDDISVLTTRKIGDKWEMVAMAPINMYLGTWAPITNESLYSSSVEAWGKGFAALSSFLHSTVVVQAADDHRIPIRYPGIVGSMFLQRNEISDRIILAARVAWEERIVLKVWRDGENWSWLINPGRSDEIVGSPCTSLQEALLFAAPHLGDLTPHIEEAFWDLGFTPRLVLPKEGSRSLEDVDSSPGLRAAFKGTKDMMLSAAKDGFALSLSSEINKELMALTSEVLSAIGVPAALLETPIGQIVSTLLCPLILDVATQVAPGVIPEKLVGVIQQGASLAITAATYDQIKPLLSLIRLRLSAIAGGSEKEPMLLAEEVLVEKELKIENKVALIAEKG